MSSKQILEKLLNVQDGGKRTQNKPNKHTKKGRSSRKPIRKSRKHSK